jgi:DNA-binding beta-propeller fold protein YncE
MLSRPWLTLLAGAALAAGTLAAPPTGLRGPNGLAVSADGAKVFVTEDLGRRLTIFDTASDKVAAEVPLPAAPSGLVLTPDGSRVFVTCPLARLVCSIDPAAGKLMGTIGVGYGATAPVVTADGAILAVCNQFDETVTLLDAHNGKLKATVKVTHFPAAAAASRDGKLFVANLLPVGPANANVVAAKVDVIDLAAAKLLTTIDLPDGSGSLRGVAVSPDDQTVYVSHQLARYHQPTTQLERGWMNTNALTLIDVKSVKRINTVLLDDVDRGAANPWAVACAGTNVVVTHAGTHEVSVIDAAGLGKLLDAAARHQKSNTADDGGEGAPTADEVPDDLTFVRTVRKRVALGGLNGPRALAVRGNTAWVAGYFSDDLASVALDTRAVKAHPLGPAATLTAERRGELKFCDARLCFQQWQSCLTCHPETRADGFNWDLLNDGIGNPKNTKSMVLAMRQSPVMSLGVRANAMGAIRAGFRFIEFAVRPDEDSVDIEHYFDSLQTVPSPHLVNGRLNEAAQRGKKIFENPKVGCTNCHNGPMFSDQKGYDLGLATGIDKGRPFTTAPLLEVWRTGPYLFDGRSAAILDVLTKDNPQDRHGHTSHLKPQELNDLAEYVLSL